MIHIVKEKKGFAVKSVADNGELLATSETLSSNGKCWVNIRAMFKEYASYKEGFAFVQDDTVSTLKVWCLEHGKRKYVSQFEKPKPRYQPGINLKKKKK